MARVWQPLKNPDHPATRSRSTILRHPGHAPTQWGQRPMFSEPGENQPPPEEGLMPQEIRTDAITPMDGRPGSEGVAELRKSEAVEFVMYPTSPDNVASPPTDAQIRAAMAPTNRGESFIIQDNGGAGKIWLIIRGGSDTYYYVGLTKAT